MALSSHRKLNVEQLINLTQVYWDDPGKLMEIVEATEARMDPAAQLLFGAVTNRLNRLRSDPMRALGETPPDLAALIAARLGTQTTAPVADDAHADAPADEARDESNRRRWPAAVAALLLLLGGVAAWWLWPRADDEVAEIAGRKIGIEIQEGGLQPLDEEEKSATASGAPRGRRQPRLAELPELEVEETDAVAKTMPAHDAAEAEARAARIAEAAAKDGAPVRELAAREMADGNDAAGSGAGGSASAGNAAARAATRAAARSTAGASGRSGSVAIEEATLQCYLSDSRPNACSPAAGGGAAASGSGSRATPQSGNPAGSASGGASSSPAAGSRASRTASTPAGERPRSQPDGGGGGGSGNGGGGAGGSAAAGSGAAQGGAGRAERPAAQASAGGKAQAAAAPPRQPQQVAAPANPECPQDAPQGRVVFIFDGSVSMGLPLGLDPAEEDRLDQGVLRRDPEARRQYRALLQQPGPKRMARAQDAFADAAGDLPDGVDLGLIVFQECRDIRQVGIFDAAARDQAIDYVDNLVPRGRTPLAQSLASAAAMLGDGPSSIVLLTDGIEFCRGDPCAVAAEIKAAKPRTPIHIVDVTGQARTACVAELTGGRSYAPTESDDLGAVLRNAFRGAAPSCPARP